MEDLPTEYDVIVIGTGMTGSIVAAALSRVGKAVLHLDENEYYGEEWASFNLDTIDTWLNAKCVKKSTEDVNKLLEPPEIFVPADIRKRYSDVRQEWFCPEKVVKEEPKVVDEESIAEEEVGRTVEEQVEGAGDDRDDSWTQEKMKAEHRKFNLDLSPKMLYSRGSMVELLISSNIARYAEFKSVSRVLTWRDDRLEVVPCSRADVFATRDVSVVQKRMLVKILTLFAEYPACAEEFQGFENKTFVEYLKHKKLDDQLIHYILYAIAMGGDSTPCLEGVASCQRFLQSLGRYGNTPFICPLYGSGELPQCFCRLCAVFGGVYHLKRPVNGFVVNGDSVVAIISGGQRLKAQQFVVTSSLCPPQYLEPDIKPPISRGIFITDRSLVESVKEAVTLLQFPPHHPVKSPVTVMEMGSSCHVCPEGLFVVHMTSELGEEDPLAQVQTALFRESEARSEETDKPAVLWALTWRVEPGNASPSKICPQNLKVLSGPDSGIDFDASIAQAKETFKELCPEEEFLPRAPDPEEIVLEDPEPPVESVEGENSDPHCEVEKVESSAEEKAESQEDKEKGPVQQPETEMDEISDKVTEQALISDSN